MNTTETTYRRGWDRAFERVAAERAVERAGRPTAAADLLDYGEAAARLKVTTRTLRNLIARGELTRIVIPSTNALRVAAADVAALVERGREAR
jgi:hypothetical protein